MINYIVILMELEMIEITQVDQHLEITLENMFYLMVLWELIIQKLEIQLLFI